jgi:hypothetical protein
MIHHFSVFFRITINLANLSLTQKHSWLAHIIYIYYISPIQGEPANINNVVNPISK